MLFKLQYIFNQQNLILLFNAIGLSHIFYGDIIYLNAWSQSIFNAVNSKYVDCGRIILFNRKGSSQTSTLAQLNWLNLRTILFSHKMSFIFKCLNNKSTYCLAALFNPVNHNHATRSSATAFIIPYMSTNRGKNSFCYWGPFVWNSLPNELNQITSIATFKKEILKFANNVL